MRISAGAPVYTLVDRELDDRVTLAEFEICSWRYLLFDNDCNVWQAALGPLEDLKLAFLGVCRSPLAPVAVEALRFAEQLPEVASKDYELRFLDLPAVHFRALWLYLPDGSLVIPLDENRRRDFHIRRISTGPVRRHILK